MKKFFTTVLLIVILLAIGYYQNSNKIDRQNELESKIEEVEATPVPTPTPIPTPEPTPLPDPVDIYADFSVKANADNSFRIETNLPDETELMLKLKGRGYLAQDSTRVKNGAATSSVFTNRGEQLTGNFELTVTMPIVNVQTKYVQHFIGSRGEYLKGKYVKGALGSVIVEKTFKVKLPGSGS